MVSTRMLGGRSSSGVGTWCPAPALTYSFTAKLELLTGFTGLHDGRIISKNLILMLQSYTGDCLGCAVLLCLVVYMTLLASFFLPSHLSLKHNIYIYHMTIHNRSHDHTPHSSIVL